MRRLLIVLIFSMTMFGCFREWPDPASRVEIFEGPLAESCSLEPAEYQNGIRVYNSYIDIEVFSGPTINGTTVFYTDDNGEYWVLLDTSAMAPGSDFTVEINKQVRTYTVID